MDEHQDIPVRAPMGGGTGTIFQFLSLYLLVLAFFIVLVSISTFEEIKSSAVMDSLTSTFASVLPPSTSLTAFTSKEGQVLDGPDFQQEVNALFSTAIGITKIEVVQPGRVMRVIMGADGMFTPGETTVRDAQYALLDRLVASMSSRPSGLVYDIEIVVGNSLADDRGMSSAQGLEMARAGALARELLARGAPPDALAIGMRHADPNQIVMWFHVRPQEEAYRLLRALAASGETR
jgi:flagellar motor protein MotB